MEAVYRQHGWGRIVSWFCVLSVVVSSLLLGVLGGMRMHVQTKTIAFENDTTSLFIILTKFYI